MLGRKRRHVPDALPLEFVAPLLETCNLNSAEEVLITAYIGKNLVKGTRAQDEYLLDWADVQRHTAAEEGGSEGLALQCLGGHFTFGRRAL